MPNQYSNKYSREELISKLRDFNQDISSFSSNNFTNWAGISINTITRYFGSWGNFVDEVGLKHDFIECPECGNLYPKLGSHWRWNSDHRPNIDDRQHEILTGLLMGDGTVQREGNPNMKCRMTTPEFLEWIDEEMGILGCGVKFEMSAEESARNSRERKLNFDAHEDDYSDVYIWSSRNHPDFSQYSDWYSTGRKRFPDDLELTPLIMKVWFCGDGSLRSDDRTNSRPYLSIAASNEEDRREFLFGLFSEQPAIPKWTSGSVYFSVDDSEYLWEYMGDPLPGFEYKWPDN